MKTQDEKHLVLTIDEARKMLRISRGSAYEAVRCGQIPSIRVGRRILIPREALERLLEGRQNGDKATVSVDL